MARQVRIEYPGAVYHCVARGNCRDEIISGDGDREAFVALLEELVGQTGWRMYSGDHVRERRRYLKHLDEVALSDGGQSKLAGDGERSLQSSLRRGWYLGAEEYREKLLMMLEAGKKKGGHRRVSGYTGDQQRDHGEAMAERIVVAGLDELGMSEEDLAGMKKGDWRKRVIGRVVREKTAIRLTWLAERLEMGNVSGASKLVSSAPGADGGKGLGRKECGSARPAPDAEPE